MSAEGPAGRTGAMPHGRVSATARHHEPPGEIAAVAGADAIRELAIAAAVLVGLSRFLEGPLVAAIAGLVLGATLVGALQVLGEIDPAGESSGIPIESLLVAAVTAAGAIGAIRLVPAGLLVLPAMLGAGALVARGLATEAALLTASRGPTTADRQGVLLEILVAAFLGFTGVAALVPGGLPEPGAVGVTPLSTTSLAMLAAGDALVAGLLGYRAAALRAVDLRSTLWSAATYAAVVAIGAAALRAADLPRLLGPALLGLVFFLWDAFHGTPPVQRRDPRWIWQTALLVALGAVFVAWNSRLGS